MSAPPPLAQRLEAKCGVWGRAPAQNPQIIQKNLIFNTDLSGRLFITTDLVMKGGEQLTVAQFDRCRK